MKKTLFIFTISAIALMNCTQKMSDEELLRTSYVSEVAGEERDFYVYLPKDYHTNTEKKWPVIMFLHGDGERGNGKEELDFVMVHGPLYEAWVQKKELPFILIVPQLHMFGRDTMGVDYLTNRDVSNVPKRLEDGTPEREPYFPGPDMFGIEDVKSNDFRSRGENDPFGWNNVENDLLGMLDSVHETYRTDQNRVYLTGLSYGGFGTWHMASNFPNQFAAISPVVGYGHPDQMPPIAEAQLPVWAFAGGLDFTVPKQYFYRGLNELKNTGHPHVLFTVHEDLAHDAWKRVYASEDLYSWFLTHQKKES